MSEERLARALQAAVETGVLPARAVVRPREARPWPVVLLIALGAWLVAWPFTAVVGLLFGDLLRAGPGPYVVGALVLAVSLVVLRSRSVPLFFEQLAVPGLLVAAGALGVGLYRDLSAHGASAVLALVALGAAWAVPQAWLRVLLGALAGLSTAFAFAGPGWLGESARWGLAWHASFAIVAALAALQQEVEHRRPLLAALLEPVNAGWLLSALAGLALWSGVTFLVAGSLGAPEAGSVLAPKAGRVLPALSVALAAGAAVLAAARWPALRRPWCAVVAAVLVALAWPMPALGAVLLALAHAATTRRHGLAGAAALAAAWTVGAFYYALHWPLVDKALALLGAGIALGAVAWRLLVRRRGAPSQDAPAVAPARAAARRGAVAAGVAAAAALAVANAGIWRKENLIAHGAPVFVELAPVDPRSMMQGDYMRLAFRLPPEVARGAAGTLARASVFGGRPHIVGRRDARGVVTLLRLDEGAPLAADELRIELTPQGGRWGLVTDAWFFREGEAQRWQRARYGEFRVEPGGRALLVGLRGPDLEPL